MYPVKYSNNQLFPTLKKSSIIVFDMITILVSKYVTSKFVDSIHSQKYQVTNSILQKYRT